MTRSQRAPLLESLSCVAIIVSVDVALSLLPSTVVVPVSAHSLRLEP